MKKILFTMLMAVSISAVSAQQVHRDNEGDYHYETRDRQVWIPEQRVGGIFGVGGRVIPGHYETRSEQVKIYHHTDRNYRYGADTRGWQGKHPHGMPPGQRKKLQNNWQQSGDWNTPGRNKKGKR